ncbi:MAG: GNAT family N-acetyltransferase [Planctomycetota bacterium]
MPGFEIRRISADDDPMVARIIRDVMTEFDAVGPGYSFVDPEVDAMSKHYAGPGSAFFVAETDDGVVGCAGIARLVGGEPDVCELRKMYVLPAGRGLGAGRALLEHSLRAATEHGYRLCYLETLGHMKQAQKLYESYGFERLEQPMGNTGHNSCDRYYAKRL